MATEKNPWVSYLDRGYQQIKASILNRLSTYAPELSDRSESNPLIILISIFSGIAEMLGYYIDQIARESFISTARRYSSVAKHAILHDYHIKASIPASADVEFTLVDSGGSPIAIASDFTIPAGTQLQSGSMDFITTETAIIPAGSTSIIIGVSQKVYSPSSSIGVSDGSADQVFALPSNYAHDSLTLYVDGTIWERRDTLGRSTPTDQHYIVEVTPQKIIQVKFGDDTYGAIPPIGTTITGDMYLTSGIAGNVTENSITTIVTSLTPPAPATGVEANNPIAASGGDGIEALEKLRKSIIYSIRTLDRAVTRQDFTDLARLAPGVGKANAFHECGNVANVYITPVNGGIPSTLLLASTQAYLDDRRLITTTIDVSPAGESYLALNLSVVAKFRRDPVQTYNDVVSALLDAYSSTTSDINKAIYLSDIISIVDNLEKVEYLTVNSLSLVPYARPISHDLPLFWTRQVTSNSLQKVAWKLVYMGSYFYLYRNSIFNGVVYSGVQYTTPQLDLVFTINSSSYLYGNTWEFTTYPYNRDTQVDDNTLVVVDEDYLTITVTPILVQNN